MPPSEIPAGVAAERYAPKPHDISTATRELSLGILLGPLDPMRHSMDDDEMARLQNSIREDGLHQNLCVVPVVPGDGDTWVRVEMADYDAHIARGGMFRVAAGHRRLIACRAVRHDPVMCKIFLTKQIPEEQIMHTENEHREQTSDFDLAVLYAKWLREPGMTENELKRRSGKSLEFVYGRAELLEGYEFVATALADRKITFAVARAINRCDEPDFAQHFLNMAIDQGATGKLVGAWIAERKAFKDMTPEAGPAQPQTLHVTAQAFQKVECLVCGETQSYNLQTVMCCGACRERITAARAMAEQAEIEAPQNG